jgi:hypothetical protein
MDNPNTDEQLIARRDHLERVQYEARVVEADPDSFNYYICQQAAKDLKDCTAELAYIDQIVNLKNDLDEAYKALFRCYELAGSDTDGDDWKTAAKAWLWPKLPERAVRAVEELRADYMEACENIK